MDRTCENCKWFRAGKVTLIKGWFHTTSTKESDTCGFLNMMPCNKARMFNTPDVWGIQSGYIYVAREKQVEGPCKAEGKFWEPK